MRDHVSAAALWMILIGALIVETFPMAAFGMIAAAWICVRIAEGMKKPSRRCEHRDGTQYPGTVNRGAGGYALPQRLHDSTNRS